MAEFRQTPDAGSLRQSLVAHVHRFFSAGAVAAFNALDMRFMPHEDAFQVRGRAVVIPIDATPHVTSRDPWSVPFNRTQLTLWHRLAKPTSQDWTPVPDAEAPLWYLHDSGTLVPAWDLAGVISGLLGLQEEHGAVVDKHGRFPASASPRREAGLLEVPAFNEAAAALVAAAMAATPVEAASLPADAVRAPTLVLSHDVDVLMGNDPWAQFMRLGGALAPLAGFRAPNYDYLRWMAENSRDPRHYYLDDVERMVTAEVRHGFRSAFYFLMGRRGRYGPRYGPSAVREALRAIPVGWETGIHYGYYSHLQDDAFEAEIAEFGALLGRAPRSGRAHYLRYDPVRSPAFLARFGVAIDESLGYADAVGYRAGIAGPYEIPGILLPDGRPMLEMPLAIMDGPLLDYEDPLGTYERMLRHLSRVGGALSVLTHPGTMDNPQRPKARGLYESMLAIAEDLGADGIPAQELLYSEGERT